MCRLHRYLVLARVLVIGVVALGLCVTAAAQSKGKGKGKVIGLDPQGEPKGFQEGLSARYAIWHNKNGWHLRVTTAKPPHDFRGRLAVEGGELKDAHSFHLEKEGQLADIWRLNAAKNELAFDFKTSKGIDGVNFHLTPNSQALLLELYIDGKEHHEDIYIGHEGHHPKDIPFALPAHPVKGKN